VLGISSWYLLKQKHVEFAKRSFRIASAFGLASALSVIVLGDVSGYAVTESQKSKLASIEAMWETEPAPAAFTVIASINEEEERNNWSVQVPYALGLIATHSTSEKLPGIKEIRAANRVRIESGIKAVVALEQWRKEPDNAQAKATFEKHQADMGYGLLVKRYTNDVSKATPDMLDQAAHDTVPKVAPLFWSFRIMVGLGVAMLALFAVAFWSSLRSTFVNQPWLLKWALYFIPVPWIAAQAGWIVAEYGRQPWTVFGMLPTHLSVSSLSAASVWGSIAGFVGFYTLLLIAEMYLMFKYARLGPSVLQPATH
jgi:cytochrome d ubiquinol oxidase subunit I